MKKTIKMIAILVAFLLVAGILFIANAFVGNPVSKIIVNNNAKKYISQTYPNTDYYIDRVGYDFKTGGYYVNIKSPSSKDTYFSVNYNLWGKVGYDNYSSRVRDGFNTWNRVNSEYRDVVDEIIENLPYESDINYGEIQPLDKGDDILQFGLDMAKLELDKEYDIKEIGSKHGKVVLYVYLDEITIEKASEVLLEVKKQFDAKNQSFYAIDLVLRQPQNKDIKDWQDTESIRIECFLSSDIEEKGLTDKIQKNIIETEKYNEELENIKENEMKSVT